MTNYDGPRHRGGSRISEGPAFRRKYATKGLRVSQRDYYQAWKAANDEAELLQAELEAREEAAFRLAMDMIKFKNHPTFEMIVACYKASHPRATLKKAS